MSEVDSPDASPSRKAEASTSNRHRDRYLPASRVARAICVTILLLLLLTGIAALVLYLVYRPSKPQFTAVSANISDLNSTATAISASMQFTLLSHNPNRRSSVHYDRLRAYVTYRSQPITPPAAMPPLYQERASTVAMTPALGGAYVPVSGDVAAGLAADEGVGAVALTVIVMGRVKYKAGPFRSPWYGMFVSCDVLVGFRRGFRGQVPLLGAPYCHVDV